MAITLGLASLGHGGGMSTHIGTFSHTAGAALETFSLGSGQCVAVRVANLDSGAKKEIVDFSQSGTTVTVNKLDAVTTGRIEVDVLRGN